MNITLKGGTIKEYSAAISVGEIAKELGAGLYKSACGAIVNGKVCDLRTIISQDADVAILTFDDEDGAKIFRHTASHILAAAVQKLFPDAKFAIGPAIDGGFYYDFDVKAPFSSQDLEKLESEMKAIVKADLPIEKFELSADKASELMASQPYKLELIKEHSGKGEQISFYKIGDFTDLCAGPHLLSTGSVKAIKLTSATGAYWRGDSAKASLCRVYGTAFPKQGIMEAYLAAQEEAKKRDHNKIGRELEYFTTSELIGQGLPILLPNGARAIQLLQRFVEDEEQSRGWQLTKTPFMAKSDLYKVSGHWDHYLDGMFVLGDAEKGEEVFALRPMTCPFQYQAYLNRPRSYRDLPLRYNETSTLFRNEASGEMHGLIRVRQFTISEGHLMCTPEQLEDEFRGCLEIAIYMLKTLGLYEDVSYRFSLWDENDTEKYIGSKEIWDETQDMMRKILNHLEIPYKEGVGEAAFYGPKLDIQIRNVYGKEDTLITIQIDRLLAEKFGMEYTDADGKKKIPSIIHRTSIGCYERTLALLLEKYAGALPVWLMPTQVMLVPISDAHHDYASKVLDMLKAAGIRAEADWRAEKMGYKIREAQLKKIPYMLVLGNDEMESETVSVRARKEENGGKKSIQEFIDAILQEIQQKTI